MKLNSFSAGMLVFTVDHTSAIASQPYHFMYAHNRYVFLADLSQMPIKSLKVIKQNQKKEKIFVSTLKQSELFLPPDKCN